MRRFVLALVLVAILACSIVAEEARLLRFPDVSKDNVAFSYGGDIFVAPRAGGQAIQLTSDKGLELFAKFSPEGSRIAFTGQYDGDWAVYVMPVTGGQPKRLTWHPGIQEVSERFGPENLVMGWHPDGKRIIFRSRKTSGDVWDGRVYMVSVDGGLPEVMPMAKAGFTSLSPDLQKVAYCPIYRDFRTWKRYKGGMAQDVWIFDLNTYESQKITDWIGTDNMPMWYADRIFFNSDRTKTLNLHAYDPATKQTRQVTEFTDFDVRWPSLGKDGIVFENGGFLYVMDLPSEQVYKLTIELTSDQHRIRTDLVDVSDRIADYDISPNGKRVVFSARGDLFTVPVKEGNTRHILAGSSFNADACRWSPDGKWIAYGSDASGEQELYVVSHDGAESKQLTFDASGSKYGFSWSPDSRKLAFYDMNMKLFLVDIAGNSVQQIDAADNSYFGDLNWSPDSRFLAYEKRLLNRIEAIFIYAMDDNLVRQVTPGLTNDYSAQWDPKGKYLYFMSERNFNPILGSYEFTFVNQAIRDLYVIVLQADGVSPFQPGSDEAVSEDDADADEHKNGDKDKKEDADIPQVRIDFEGIFDRQVAVDLPAGNYRGLQAIDGAVFYTSGPIRGLGGNVTQEPRVLHKYDLEKQKDSEFLEGIGGYRLTPDGKHFLVSKSGSYYVIGTGGSKADLDDARLDLKGLTKEVDFQTEYAQMYDEVWRGERDFFYDPNMHGVDWKSMHDKYAVLLPYVTHRFDFIYVLGEMLGELACSHSYVGGGVERPANDKIGLLGVDFAIDEKANRIRIERILEGENFDEDICSPLREPGVDIRPGDYLLAINGENLTGDMNPYQLTRNTVGKRITLTVNSRPTMDGARSVEVRPIARENNLRYFDGVQRKLHYVDSVSNGQIGYIHIPDMDSYGLYRFTKMFYNQMRRPGLIIDVRYNGGGFVSGLILERLRRTVAAMDRGRYGKPDRSPGAGINAHMVTLLNEFSCSDGDYFPYFFREYKLGPLMGKRSWGGVIGINGFNRLADGGYYTIPGYGIFNLEGEWVLENVGVHPDIEIDNLPGRLVQGYDDQLDRAIEYILEKQKTEPLTLPEAKGAPQPR